MSKNLVSKFLGLFGSKMQVGVDRAGNRYFTRMEKIDGLVKEKRWVVFKGEQDPTTIPVEWTCWLNGQRKKAPTAEELIELEARRERVRQNIELLKKKEEEERKTSGASPRKKISKDDSPDLRSFIQQISSDDSPEGGKQIQNSKDEIINKERSTEPTGSGSSFKPGTWQPPT